MKQTIEKITAVAIGFALTPLFGGDNVWVNATGQNIKWADSAGSWLSGTVPDWSPSAALADTTYITNETAVLQNSYGQSKDDNSSSHAPVYLYQNSVEVSANHAFMLTGRGCIWKVNDLSRCLGWLGAYRDVDDSRTYGLGARCGIDFLATPEHTPIANSIDLSGRFQLNNMTTDNSTALVKEVFGDGIFDVNTGSTSRKIEIGASAGGNDLQAAVAKDSVLVVNGATLEPGVKGDPWLHLDASVQSSIENGVEDDGRSVAKWMDVRGNRTDYPWAEGTQGNARPRTATDSATGLGIVDFGYPNGGNKSYRGEADYIGHVGYLRLREAGGTANITKAIVESFWVFRDNSASNQTSMVLGSSLKGCPFSRPYKGGYYNSAPLFANYSWNLPLRSGLVYLDGHRIRPSEIVDTVSTFRLVNVALNGVADVQNIGMYDEWKDENRNSNYTWWGGFKLAEMILYTNRLTSAERAAVNAYLAKKWQVPGYEQGRDFGRVTLAKGAELEVKAGTVRVGGLAVSKENDEFVKRGEGDLELSRYAGPAKLHVEGGSVRFVDGDAEVDDSAIASDPLFRFDADVAANAMVISNGTGAVVTNYVTRWNSSYTNSAGLAYYAVRGTAGETIGGTWTLFSSKCPFVTMDTPTGRRAVDFGSYASLGGHASGWTNVVDTAFMDVKREGGISANQRQAREIFAVIKRKHDAVRVIGGSTYEFLVNGGYASYENYAPGSAQGMTMTINGEDFDWRSAKVPTDRFLVVNLRYSTAVMPDQLSGDRGIYTMGAYVLCEEIAYPRRLTEKERVNTEAYLMKKWLGEDHPRLDKGGYAFASVSYGAAAEPEVMSDLDMTAEVMTVAASGTLVKRGMGDCTVKAFSGAVEAIDVEEGSLSIGVPPAVAKAMFHLDASDADTLVISNDVATGNRLVTSWRDPVSGITATPTYETDRNRTVTKGAITRSWSEFAAYPRYQMHAVGDRTMPHVNFGGHSKGDDPSYTWSEWSAGMQLSKAVNFREVHTVFCDIDQNEDGAAAVARANFVTSSGNYKYSRGGALICAPSAWVSEEYIAPTRNGVLMLDGETREPTYKVTDFNFHVFGSAPLEAISSDRICADRVTARGGQKICEMLFFESPLSNDERTALQAYLYNKWCGAGVLAKPVISYSAFSVSAESTLTLSNDWATISAGVISGGGTIKTPGVTASSFAPEGTLSLVGDVAAESGFTFVTEWRGAEDYDRIVVDGTFTVPVSGTVNLTLGEDVSLMPVGSCLELVTATSIANPQNLRNWTCNVPEQVRGKPGFELVDGSRILLVIRPRGTTIIIK